MFVIRTTASGWRPDARPARVASDSLREESPTEIFQGLSFRGPLLLGKSHLLNIEIPPHASRASTGAFRPMLWSELIKMGRWENGPAWQTHLELNQTMFLWAKCRTGSDSPGTDL